MNKLILALMLLSANSAYAAEGMVGNCAVSCDEVRAVAKEKYDSFRSHCENRYSGIALTNPEGSLICISKSVRTFSGITGHGKCNSPAAIRRFLNQCELAAESWQYGKNIGNCYTQKNYAIRSYKCMKPGN